VRRRARQRGSLALLAAFLGLYLVSCGIETFVYLYPVTYRDFEPSAEGDVNNYFSFRTSDNRNEAESSGYFKGFEIYYRIYNNSSTRINDKTLINNYNNDNPTTAYTFLLNSKLYKRLSCTVRPNDVPLIPGSDTNRAVIVRLKKYIDQNPQISVSGDSSLYGEPRRTTDETGANDKLFDLDEIDQGDSDLTYNSSWDTNGVGKKLAYVQAYVVAYGYDGSYKSLYSELFELGYITLTEE
jgi:hypothetical protein